MIRLVVCEPLKLIYRPLPKCATTTLFALLGRLGGAGPASCPRDALPTVSPALAPGHGGSYIVRADDQALAELMHRCADYVWFSVVRNPYARVASNYHNKINRFARRFQPGLYFWTCASHALRGPVAWRDDGARLRRIQASIPFERFVHGLREHGVDWDPHFRLQSKLLQLHRLHYHQLVKMEDLAGGLREVFVQAGAAEAGETAIAGLGWLNRSGATTAAELWTPATRAVAADVYRPDFAALGYGM